MKILGVDIGTTAMYNTSANNLTWDNHILEAFGIPASRLPELMPAYHSTGRLKSLFCSEMTDEAFFEDFMPRAIDTWLEKDSGSGILSRYAKSAVFPKAGLAFFPFSNRR